MIVCFHEVIGQTPITHEIISRSEFINKIKEDFSGFSKNVDSTFLNSSITIYFYSSIQFKSLDKLSEGFIYILPDSIFTSNIRGNLSTKRKQDNSDIKFTKKLDEEFGAFYQGYNKQARTDWNYEVIFITNRGALVLGLIRQGITDFQWKELPTNRKNQKSIEAIYHYLGKRYRF